MVHPIAAAAAEDPELGRGRSGIVYRSRDDAGRAVARKVFAVGGLNKAVHYVFSGAPNPYMWSEPAIRAAVLRRRILAELVEVWFGSRLRVARAYDYGWNAKCSAFEMRCELMDGRHVGLHHPYTAPNDCELRDVTQHIMKPLQARLAEAGFDGLVWQAGRGNPVALNNFMRQGQDGQGGNRWAWIDLESGVPALIPINPLDLLLFYLPKSLRHRCALFDDVDVDKLRAYVSSHVEELDEKLGGERLRQLNVDIDALEQDQRKWKSLARHRRSIAYRRASGSINEEQAKWYDRRPLRWYSRESLRGLRAAPAILSACLTQLWAMVSRIKPGRLLKASWAAIASQQCRVRLAREYVSARIIRWQARGQLSERHAARLQEHLRSEEASSYLSDFGVHLAVKPLVKIMEWWVMPALWMAGAIDEVSLGAFLLAAGPCVRTVYTLVRLMRNAVAGRERPWVPLFVGAVPVIGNLAYPLQIVVSGANAQASIAQFILYDTLARVGRWMPIWGGPDTRTEHTLNRLVDVVIGLRRRAVDSPTGAIPAACET